MYLGLFIINVMPVWSMSDCAYICQVRVCLQLLVYKLNCIHLIAHRSFVVYSLARFFALGSVTFKYIKSSINVEE